MNKSKLDATRLNANTRPSLQDLLQLAQLRAEKCELKEARDTYLKVLHQATRLKNFKLKIEAISGLLLLAAEALDHESIEKWDRELDRFIASQPDETPPMVWYCKGAVARLRRNYLLAQRYFHRYLRAVRAQGSAPEQMVRGWVMLAILLRQRGRSRRSLWLATEILRRIDAQGFGKERKSPASRAGSLESLKGFIYLLIGTIHERQKDYLAAKSWFQKAHTQFLAEHNWYYHLYVLIGYARIERYQHNYDQSSWYLDMVAQVAAEPEFGQLKQDVQEERARLEQSAIDLLIDTRKGLVKTRESGAISLRKQYVLLHILEALFEAHHREGADLSRGLSKSEIIEYVWKESYQPDTHDNKLYYNINRLRKLIEPNVRKPQYLLNWKEGYRLAPGLRIQRLGDQAVGLAGETS